MQHDLDDLDRDLSDLDRDLSGRDLSNLSVGRVMGWDGRQETEVAHLVLARGHEGAGVFHRRRGQVHHHRRPRLNPRLAPRPNTHGGW